MFQIFILPIEKLLHTLRISCLVSRANCSEANSQELCPHYSPLTVALGGMPYVLTVLWIVISKSLSLTKHGLEPQLSFKVGSLMELPWPGIFRGFPSDNAALSYVVHENIFEESQALNELPSHRVEMIVSEKVFLRKWWCQWDLFFGVTSHSTSWVVPLSMLGNQNWEKYEQVF